VKKRGVSADALLRIADGEVCMRDKKIADSSAETGVAALDHLEKALRLLDKFGAPGEIGAYVDLAIHRLRAAMGPGQSDRQSPKSGE
jgi:hypothetical protein